MAQMNIINYLHRIHINQAELPSLDFLSKLIYQHLISVPFENLDIGRGVRILLDEKHLYNKIVVQGRGGFCFELNGLFAGLLKALGFSVTLASARVFNSGNNEYGPEFDHLILLVDLSERYLVDVGFGDLFRGPLSLNNDRAEDVGGEYRLINSKETQNFYVVQKHEKNGWQPQYRFTEISRTLSDFHDMCAYHQTSPDSHFTQKTICTIATEDGRKTLTDSDLMITKGREKKKIRVSSQKDFNRLLQEHFQIKLKFMWAATSEWSPKVSY